MSSAFAAQLGVSPSASPAPAAGVRSDGLGPSGDTGAFGALMGLLGAAAAGGPGEEVPDTASRDPETLAGAAPVTPPESLPVNTSGSDLAQSGLTPSPSALPVDYTMLLLAQGSLSGAIRTDAAGSDTVLSPATALTGVSMQSARAGSRATEAASASFAAAASVAGASNAAAAPAVESNPAATGPSGPGAVPRFDDPRSASSSPAATPLPTTAASRSMANAAAADASHAASERSTASAAEAANRDLPGAATLQASSPTSVQAGDSNSEAPALLRPVFTRVARPTQDDGASDASHARAAVSSTGSAVLPTGESPLPIREAIAVTRAGERRLAHSTGLSAAPGAEAAGSAGVVAGAPAPFASAEAASLGGAGLHAAFTERIVDQVSWWLSQKVQGADFQIEMPGGRPVSVNVQVQGNEAQVVFRSDQAEVRQLLGQALPQLKEAFGSEGLLLAGVSVGVGTDSANQARERDAAHGGRSTPPGRLPGGAASEPVAAVAANTRRSPWQATGGGLDLWA